MYKNIPDREVITKFMSIQAPGEIPQNYNAVNIINMGTKACTVAGIMPLAAGASVGWSHNQFEINKSQIDIDFPAGNGTQNVVVILTYFKDNDY